MPANERIRGACKDCRDEIGIEVEGAPLGGPGEVGAEGLRSRSCVWLSRLCNVDQFDLRCGVSVRCAPWVSKI